MKFKDKVVLVTGSSRGIGRATALLFGKEGAKVVVNYYKSEKQAQDVVSKIKDFGSEAISVKCDVSKEDEVKKMMDQILKKFGRIDILVNNAGIVYDIPFFEKSIEKWRRTIDVNLIGVYLCSKYVAKIMKKQGSGNIINISSTNGINTTSPASIDYDATKSGVISITKNLAEELAPDIRVNCIAPGWIDTDINKELPKEYIESEGERTLMKRFGNPEEIATVVLFLASDDSSFMTGSIVVVDGGYK